MLKEYVCSICHGSGQQGNEVVVQEPDDWPEAKWVWEPCSSCVGRGIPSRIEVPINGPPAAKERVIDMETAVVPITRTLDGDPWKHEESPRVCSEEGHLTYGENCFHVAAKPDEDKK
jgi:hypothetical protein